MNLSIVTPVYNGENDVLRLYENIKSLICTHDIEWLLVNDASTDSTEEIILSICNANSKVKLCNLSKNSGPAIARQTGIFQSSNDYVFLLDVDDFIYPEFFLEFIDYCFRKDHEYYFTPLDVIYNQEDALSYKNRIKIKKKVVEITGPMGFVFHSFPQPSSLLIKRNYFIKYNVVNSLDWGEDFLMYLCLAKYGTGVRWEKPVSCYLVNGNGRGSKLSFKMRMDLSKSLFVESIKNTKMIESLLYTTWLSSRHLISFVFKKLKLKMRG